MAALVISTDIYLNNSSSTAYSRARRITHTEEEEMKLKLALLLLLVPLAALNCTLPSSPNVSTAQSALAVCGDNSCAPGEEDCGTCPGDCPCPGGFVCSQRQCVPVCGDGSCAPGA